MHYKVWMFVIFLLHLTCDLTTESFIDAISAALATIPLTGGPIAMTAGLAGVKLAVGTKLLYYLGYFSRRGKAPKPSPVATSVGQKPFQSPVRSVFPQRYSVPLPYMFAAGGAFRQPQLGMPARGFPQGFSNQQFGVDQFIPSELLQSFGAMQETGHGHLLPNPVVPGSQGSHVQTNFPTSGGDDPSSVPQDEINPKGQLVQSEAPAEGSVQMDVPIDMHQTSSDEMNSPSGGGGESDVDSFFNFLGEMDDNMCISRLLCDIGADPYFLGEFSQNINGIISSLEVPPDSRAHHYVSIMEQGRKEKGGCTERFGHICTDGAYEIVKSVAPTVGIPSNMEDLNL